MLYSHIILQYRIFLDCCLSKQLPLSIDKQSSTSSTQSFSNNINNQNQCSLAYDINYCLNGGRCFNYTIATYSIPYCECADGFLGERCEQKYLSISYGSKNNIFSRLFREMNLKNFSRII